MSSFSRHIRELPGLLAQLLACAPCVPAQLPRTLPDRGIYLFSKGKRHLYVGRTRSLRRRIQSHSRAGSRPNVAAFATLLASESTGRRASYRRGESRSALTANPKFAAAFDLAKERIRGMTVRFVGVQDPITEALFEIYAAIELKTRYNDFETH